MRPSNDLSIFTCPHCGTTLYGESVSVCYKCNKEVNVGKRAEELRKREEVRKQRKQEKIERLSSSLWFRLKYRLLRKAFKSNAATLFVFSGFGMSDQRVSGMYHHELEGAYVGKDAWFRFAEEKLDSKAAACLKCLICGHYHLIRLPAGLDTFSCDWFYIGQSGPPGNYATRLVCTICGHESSPPLHFY